MTATATRDTELEAAILTGTGRPPDELADGVGYAFRCPMCRKGQAAKYNHRQQWWHHQDCGSRGDRADLLRRIVIMLNGHGGSSPNGNHPHAKTDHSYEESHKASADERAYAIPVLPFPADVFPPVFRTLIEDGAEALGCPPDLIGVPLLSYVAAAIGSNATIQIKRSFRQRPILWTVPVAPSGSVKTPADKIARGPSARLQHHASALYEELMATHRTDMARWKSRPSEERGPEPERPQLNHFYTTDATFESLGPMLKQSPGVVIARDEIVGLVKACDAYRGGKGGDRQRYLEAWDGTPIKIDRRTQEPLYVPSPVLGIAGGCQPLVLPELTREANQHDGFLPRILWTYPDVGPAAWTWDDVDDTRTEAAAAILSRLRTMAPVVCELHPDARTLWAEWANQNARLTRAARGIAASVSAKLTVQVSRLALVLHCLWNPDDSARMVSGERLADAIELGEYFRQHANRVLIHFDGSATARASLEERVVRALSRDGGGWVRKTDLHHRLGNNVAAADLDDVLAVLLADGRVERRTESTASKPVELWRLPTRDCSYEESPFPGEANEIVHTNNLKVQSRNESPRGIYVCDTCGDPRSRRPEPCPNCGAHDGLDV